MMIPIKDTKESPVPRSRESFGLAAFAVTVLIIFATGVFAFNQITRLNNAQEDVVHIERTLAQVEALNSATYQAESETRGFVVSGRPFLLASQREKMDAAMAILGKLESDPASSAGSTERLRAIRAALELRFASLQKLTDLREADGIEGVLPLLATGKGRMLQQNLRSRIEDLQQDERHLLLLSTQRIQRELKIARILILFAALPAVAGLSSLAFITSGLLRRAKRLGNQLQSANGTLKALLNAAPVGIFSYSTETQIGFWNTAAENIFGIGAHTLIGKPLDLMPLELQTLIASVNPASTNGIDTLDERAHLTWRREAGDEIKVRVSTAAVNPEETASQTMVAIVQDVTANLKLEQELIQVAHHDSLTGLPNRVVLTDRFEQMLKRTRRDGKRCAVFEIDIDRFKQVNDHHGHEVGDQFLRQVASRLVSALRTTDTLVRVDGDEFVCLVESLHKDEDAELVATKLLASLAEPITLDGVSLQPSISIGIALFPADGTKCVQLRKLADTALYRAKAAGRGRFVRYERNDADVRRRQIQEVMERGIESGSFFIEYQPQYTKKSELRGFEALIRLSDPSLGLISPGEFIPVAEQCGLIHEIGTWVLRKSCLTFADWIRRGYNPGVLAVNVSAAQFVRGNFVEIVADALTSSGLSSQFLELELTETMVMSDIDESSNQMHRLKSAGISLAIDDFGTGYSSLSHLHRLPIDLIKIDRSFVRETDLENKATRPIVEAILGLGKSLSIQVIAEGVETERQREYLCRIGCDYLQGFLFARPMSPLAVEAYLPLGAIATAASVPSSFELREINAWN